MSNFLKPLTEEERQARYRVMVASRALPGPKGLGYESSGTRCILLWNQISHIIAAEVGEPEGVRAVVFDLLSPEGPNWRVLRLDTEPGEEAIELAQALQRHTDPACQAASLKSVATDGTPMLWFPDLVSFEEQTLTGIR